MKCKFIAFLYFEGTILGFMEYGDCYRFDPLIHSAGSPIWTMLCYGPWPEELS